MALFDLGLGRTGTHEGGRFGDVVRGWFERSADRLKERSARKALGAYSDRMLADIGISRNQIERAVHDGRPSCDPQIPYWSR